MLKNNYKLIFLICGCTAILTIGGLVFNLIYNNHQANQFVIEKCFEEFDDVEKVVIKKDGLWSPVVCERE